MVDALDGEHSANRPRTQSIAITQSRGTRHLSQTHPGFTAKDSVPRNKNFSLKLSLEAEPQIRLYIPPTGSVLSATPELSSTCYNYLHLIPRPVQKLLQSCPHVQYRAWHTGGLNKELMDEGTSHTLTAHPVLAVRL